MRCIEGIRKLGQRGTHKWVRADGAQSQLLGGGYRPSGGADAVLVYRAKKKLRTYQHWRADEDHAENDDLTTDRGSHSRRADDEDWGAPPGTTTATTGTESRHGRRGASKSLIERRNRHAWDD